MYNPLAHLHLVHVVERLQYLQLLRYICEQVLFLYVYTIIPPRLSDPCDFITVSNPGTVADDGLLF